MFDQVRVLSIDISDFEKDHESQEDASVEIDDKSFVTAFQVFSKIVPERRLCFPGARLFVESESDCVNNWNGEFSTFGLFVFVEAECAVEEDNFLL